MIERPHGTAFHDSSMPRRGAQPPRDACANPSRLALPSKAAATDFLRGAAMAAGGAAIHQPGTGLPTNARHGWTRRHDQEELGMNVTHLRRRSDTRQRPAPLFTAARDQAGTTTLFRFKQGDDLTSGYRYEVSVSLSPAGHGCPSTGSVSETTCSSGSSLSLCHPNSSRYAAGFSGSPAP